MGAWKDALSPRYRAVYLSNCYLGGKGTLLHCWWGCKWVQLLWKAVWRVTKKTENRNAIQPSNSTSRN